MNRSAMTSSPHPAPAQFVVHFDRGDGSTDGIEPTDDRHGERDRSLLDCGGKVGELGLVDDAPAPVETPMEHDLASASRGRADGEPRSHHRTGIDQRTASRAMAPAHSSAHPRPGSQRCQGSSDPPRPTSRTHSPSMSCCGIGEERITSAIRSSGASTATADRGGDPRPPPPSPRSRRRGSTASCHLRRAPSAPRPRSSTRR